MRTAATLFLLLSITAGIFSAVDYANNEAKRREHVADAAHTFGLRTSAAYELAEINRDEDREREDLFVAMFAVSALAFSIACFSFAKHFRAMAQPPNLKELASKL
jgi:hypothetical protein